MTTSLKEIKKAENMYYKLEKLCDEAKDIIAELTPFKEEKVDKDVLKDVLKEIKNFKSTLKDISKKKTDDEFELNYLIPSCSKALTEIYFDSKENEADRIIECLDQAIIRFISYQKSLNNKYNIHEEE